MGLLVVDNITMQFGGLTAVDKFSANLDEGEILGLIGPNGAGKTTVFNCLTGMYQPTSGSINFQGKELVGLHPFEITQLGVARTFQNIRLFKNLTVLDNVAIALHPKAGYGMLQAVLRLPGFRKCEKRIYERANELLEIFGVSERKTEIAGNLPYGEQRRLEMARALAAQPKVLLLDEPAAGMNPHETKELEELIRWVQKEFSLSILLIEHDMSFVMNLCDEIVVLDYGISIAQGTPAEIRSNPRVIEAYLGEEAS